MVNRSHTSIVYFKQLLIVAILFSLAGCIAKNEIEVTLKNLKKAEALNITVSNVQVINHQIVITGTNLTAVSEFKIKEGSSNATLQIESKTSTSIVANTLTNVTFAAGKVFDFVFSSAQAAATFTVNFSLCDSTLGGKSFNCAITPNDKEVLAYDAVSGKWKPRAVNGLSYQGSWDANTAQPSTSTEGDYFIVSVANAPYQVGDWIVFNGVTFDRIDNSQMITSVFGRTGAVTGSLSDLTDIDFSPAPALNQYLKYNGTHWAPATLTYTETDPNVSAFAKAALPTCGAGQVLKGNGTSLACVTDNAGTSFTGTANRAVVTDGAGALSSSTITTTILNYLSNVTSDIQAQINSKLSSSSLVDWSTTGVQTIDPTRINLTTANRVIVTNASSNPSASAVTSTELGYLSGVTSAVQTQLNGKLSSFTETDPNVTAFAKAALPTCATGEVLKSNGTSLSCVTDSAGGGAYTGAINRVVLTDGATGALTVSTVTNTEAGYLSGVTSAIQTQLNAKQAAITTATAITSGSVQTNLQNAVTVNPYNTAAGNTGEFRFYELVANGTNYTGFKSPDLLGANIIYTMPGAAPNAGEVLSSTAGGVLSWIAIPSAPVTSINTLTGAVTLTTTNIAEGTSLYHTDARARSATVADAIADAVTNIAPSQNAVFDALALKLNSGSFIQWDTSGVQTLDPSRLNLGVPSASKAVVTDASGFIVASGATATELGYLSGVTSAIQTQLNAKQGTLGTGTVTSTHILDGTIADADLAGSIAQSKISNLTTDLGNKQSTSTLAADVRGIVLTGLSTATNAVITATDSILVAFGRLQKQITDLDSAKLSKTGGTLTVGTINGVPTPVNGDDVASKAYVDGAVSGSSLKLTINSSQPAVCGLSNDGLLALTSIYRTCVCKNGTGWVSTTDGLTACVWTGASLSIAATSGSATAMNVTGVNQGNSANGSAVTFTLSNTGGLTSATVTIGLSNTTNFTVTGGTCSSGSTALAASGSCTIIVTPSDTLNESFSGNLNITANNNPTIALSGTASGFLPGSDCSGTPSPGTVCVGGAIYLGSLSPGATSGSGTNKYMTTPGGCGEIPAGQRVGSGASAYPNADFTPTCLGTDSLVKYWNDGTSNWYDFPGITNYTTTTGTGNGASNIDQYYGSTNTTNIVAITTGGLGGYHAAARYCDRLNYGGYTDWYLPNRYELNLFWTNIASIPGLAIEANTYYWSSTEQDAYYTWVQRFTDGYQYGGNIKNNQNRFRCVRRF